MAEDFYTAFGLGHDKKYISTTDADGVAMAAIQGLYDLVKHQAEEIGQLKIQVAANRWKAKKRKKR